MIPNLNNPIEHIQSQRAEAPLTGQVRSSCAYRYAYARSAECQQNDDPGQDFLAFREDGSRLVFVLCDGVGQSFIGDLAARFLGNHLLDWLWSCPSTQAAEIQPELQAYLGGLVPAAIREVAHIVLPDDLPAMLRSVLEEKRVQGSETMLVAGLLDFNRAQAALVSLGDMRLRAWGPDLKEKTVELEMRPNTDERWSTLRGVVGNVHVKTVSLETITCIAAYSDGLARVDRMPVVRLPDRMIQDAIELSFQSPASDDISFFQVWLEQPQLEAQPGDSGLVEAQPPREQPPELVQPELPAPLPPGPVPPEPRRTTKKSRRRPLPRRRPRLGILVGVVALLLVFGAAFALGAVIGPGLLATATPTPTSTATPAPPATNTPEPSATPLPSHTATLTASPTLTATHTIPVSPSPAVTQPTDGPVILTPALPTIYPAPGTIYPTANPDAAIIATLTNTADPIVITVSPAP